MPAPVVYSDHSIEPQPIGVSALSLVNTPDAYAGTRVRILLPIRSYTNTARGALWIYGHPNVTPLLVECPNQPGMPAIDVIGTCHGRVGEMVVVAECNISVIPHRP